MSAAGMNVSDIPLIIIGLLSLAVVARVFSFLRGIGVQIPEKEEPGMSEFVIFVSC